MRTLIRGSRLAGGLALLLAMSAQAQNKVGHELVLQLSDADLSAARQATRHDIHSMAATSHRTLRESLSDLEGQVRAAAPRNGPGPNVRFPGTLVYLGGPVVQGSEQHLIYMIPSNGECPSVAACWGNPSQFLSDLGNSEFIHVTDQYVGTTANARYTVGVSGRVHYHIPKNPLTDADMQAVVHAMVVRDGGLNGYGHEYHVFLPPGQIECFDSTFTACSITRFCAYHGFADFQDVGHVIYSVEPWGGPGGGCDALDPNGNIVSAQNSTLSHELIESITDPDLDAWGNVNGNLLLFGAEIGDECVYIGFAADGSVHYLPDAQYLNGNPYLLQPEYNNHANGCTDGPLGGE